MGADGGAPEQEQVTQALWSAANANQLEAAQYLLARGGERDWLRWDNMTPLDAAENSAAADVVAWLRGVGARHAAELA